ncbi:MAG: glycosyltransferase family 4 protein [Lachnospiraceae bacterium]|nr:glycosyltransferase family 4 protein [Lachnospiraceae bacterium]
MELHMKVLWICNLMPAIIAKALHKPATNKEGWVMGTVSQVIKNRNLTLGIAYPVSEEETAHGQVDDISYFSFYEDSRHPEKYDNSLESFLGLICEEFQPDVIHCFGTEYPHTLAMLRIKEWKSRVLVHLQGIMDIYASLYYAGIPEDVSERATLRDMIKKDSIWQQKEKYEKRGENEKEVLRLAEYVCGRTEFDKRYLEDINKSCTYYTINETLRQDFYGPRWDLANCTRHTIFVAQGNYPIKGIHYMIMALAKIREDYPDVHLYVSGDNVTAFRTLKDKIKISSYGKYLRDLMHKYHLEEHVTFLGQLTSREMVERYLKTHVYVIPSVIENSPNSLGEAMLLGMPCVAAKVGGIPSLAKEEEEVLMYAVEDTDALAEAVKKLFRDEKLAEELGQAARARAVLTHDAQANYKMLCWVYDAIAQNNK